MKFWVQKHYSSTEHWHQALQNVVAVFGSRVGAVTLPVTAGSLLGVRCHLCAADAFLSGSSVGPCQALRVKLKPQKCEELFQTVGLLSAAMRGQKRPSTDKRDLKPGRAAPPLRLPHSPHSKGNSSYYEKSASEFAKVANQMSWVWRKQNSLSGQWVCVTISRFSTLPWFFDVSLCWRK